MKESEIIGGIRQKIQELGGRIWRTIPGTVWKGVASRKGHQVVLSSPSAYIIFPTGEPDCHFFEPVTITPDMVGQRFARFGKAEIKTASYQTVTKKQLSNLEAMERMGGKAVIITELKTGEIITETPTEYRKRKRQCKMTE